MGSGGGVEAFNINEQPHMSGGGIRSAPGEETQPGNLGLEFWLHHKGESDSVVPVSPHRKHVTRGK